MQNFFSALGLLSHLLVFCYLYLYLTVLEQSQGILGGERKKFFKNSSVLSYVIKKLLRLFLQLVSVSFKLQIMDENRVHWTEGPLWGVIYLLTDLLAHLAFPSHICYISHKPFSNKWKARLDPRHPLVFHLSSLLEQSFFLSASYHFSFLIKRGF